MDAGKRIRSREQRFGFSLTAEFETQVVVWRNTRTRRFTWFWVVLLAVLWASPLRAQECLESLPVVELSEETTAVVNAFGVSLKRFQALSFDEFLAEFGPSNSFPRPEPPRFLRGDGNGDGNGDETVDISDASCMLARLFLGNSCATGNCEDRLDADDNGQLDIADPIFLLNFLFRGGETLSAPQGTAGIDPTDDSLVCGVSALGYDPLKADFLDAILGSYPIDAAQEEALRENGFVSLAGQRHDTFFHTLNDIFERHLPVYISADLMLDALHLSFDAMLQTIEEEYPLASSTRSSGNSTPESQTWPLAPATTSLGNWTMPLSGCAAPGPCSPAPPSPAHAASMPGWRSS